MCSFTLFLSRTDRLQLFLVAAMVVALPAAPLVAADEPVTFTDLAADPSSGLHYQRAPSASKAIFDAVRAQGSFQFQETIFQPLKWRGAPGVAVLDYDRDGDLDLYVTNGPGAANSLFSNRLREDGVLRFVDRATAAGVAAVDQDSSGVCAGDVDNDGDPDLLVLSNFGANRFFVNRGDGSFDDQSLASGLGLDQRSSVSCSFGDVDGDGLLDVVVANTWEDMSNNFGIALAPFEYNQHNQLFLNRGDGSFLDVSAERGIESLRGFSAGLVDQPTLTWAIALVDIDADGDLDIVQADDQAGIPTAAQSPFGADRGFLHLLRNDGTGHFVDATVETLGVAIGEWMGLTFADYDGDDRLDLFGTNFGDYAQTTLTPLDPFFGDTLSYDLGFFASRALFGSEGDSFDDPGVGDLVSTAFGWGAVSVDYDADADVDIVYHGGMAFGMVIHADNFGMVLRNDGAGGFEYDFDALAGSTDHSRRVVHGVASGDLDDDGFVDLVSVSNADIQTEIPMRHYGVQWGSPLDGRGAFQVTFAPTDTPLVYAITDIPDNVDGSLSVEINGGNTNRWLKVRTVGGAGRVDGARVNRDGIGALVRVETRDGRRTTRPVLGGASYASQSALEQHFGLGRAPWATVDVLWPGGVRNRFVFARHGETVVLPEIPCDPGGDWRRVIDYARCVRGALAVYRDEGTIDRRHSARLFISALHAFFDAR